MYMEHDDLIRLAYQQLDMLVYNIIIPNWDWWEPKKIVAVATKNLSRQLDLDADYINEIVRETFTKYYAAKYYNERARNEELRPLGRYVMYSPDMVIVADSDSLEEIREIGMRLGCCCKEGWGVRECGYWHKEFIPWGEY